MRTVCNIKTNCKSYSYVVYVMVRVWPQYVRDRIHTTYAYFGSGLGITALSAMASFRSPLMMRLMTKNSLMVLILKYKKNKTFKNFINHKLY